MKKILTIFFVFISAASFSQTTVIYNKLKNDGVTFGAKDTVVKYALANTVNKYFTGYGTWGSLPDTVRIFFSVDTSRTSGGATYNPSTGVFSIPVISGGGGGSSTVKQDSSLLIATTHLSSQYPARKGLLLRDSVLSTSATAYQAPVITFQGSYNNARRYGAIVPVTSTTSGINFQLRNTNDTSNVLSSWAYAYLTLAGAVFPSNPGNYSIDMTSAGSAYVAGAKFIIRNDVGAATFGANAEPTSGNQFKVVPTSSSRFGIGLPLLTDATYNSYNNYPTAISIVNAGTATNGTYASRSIVNIHSNGSGGSATVTVSGGIVTAITPNAAGSYYHVGDTITVSGVTGLIGFVGVITTIQGQALTAGNLVCNSTTGKPQYMDITNGVTRVLIDSATISGNLTVGSASTLTLVSGQDYVFNGTTATYTLPAISTTNIGRQYRIYIKNRGSGTITLNAASGSTIYDTATQSTISITAGQACELMPDGTYFNVMYKN